jgi:hypothetical protein
MSLKYFYNYNLFAATSMIIGVLFTVVEAVVGQLYLVVVVAWFVGMFVSRKSSNSNK